MAEAPRLYGPDGNVIGEAQQTPNGFFEIYHETTPRLIYTLVAVPMNLATAMAYDKRSAGIHMRLQPHDTYRCRVSGQIDVDIIELLKLPVAKKRSGADGEIPPEVDDDSIAEMEEYGEVEQIGERHFNVDLDLSVNSAYCFVDGVWRSYYSRTLERAGVPSFHPGDKERGYAIYPEKRFVNPHDPNASTLQAVLLK